MTAETAPPRAGETRLTVDPAEMRDATLAFIGRIRSPWADRSHCPRNLREAREHGANASVEIDAPFRAALAGLAVGDAVHLLSWLHGSRRDLALQMPRHAQAPKGTFALRSPVRPNPIGLHLVRILSIDADGGLIEIDAIDLLDGTPLLDIKPYLPSVDQPTETRVPTERRKYIARQLTLLIPRAPFIDAEAIREAAGSRHMRDLPTASALWLATLAHVRHQHTDYDALRNEGYERDEALFFVIDEVNAVLDRWGSTRQLTSEPGAEDDEEPELGSSEALPVKSRPRPDAD